MLYTTNLGCYTNIDGTSINDATHRGTKSMTDARRKMRLELLQTVYSKKCQIRKIDDGDLIACAEYHHEDEKFTNVSNINLWGLQDHELIYIFSGERLDKATFDRDMERSVEETGDQMKPSKKLRSATVTTLLIYDYADDDAIRAIESHDHKVYHRMSLNGWSIHRVAAVLTDSGAVHTDKRAAKLARRLTNIAEL